MDSNQRRTTPTGLQTAPFGRSGNPPRRPGACRCDEWKDSKPRGGLVHPCPAARSAPSRRAVRTVEQDREGAVVAAESSFDVVSKVDRQEVDNALNQAAKEIQQRYDFKGTGAAIAWSGDTIVMR